MRGSDDIREVEEPERLGKVLRVGLVGPETFEGHLVLGLLAGAARLIHLGTKTLLTTGFIHSFIHLFMVLFSHLVRLRVFLHRQFAELGAQSARVHGPGPASKAFRASLHLKPTLSLSLDTYSLSTTVALKMTQPLPAGGAVHST